MHIHFLLKHLSMSYIQRKKKTNKRSCITLSSTPSKRLSYIHTLFRPLYIEFHLARTMHLVTRSVSRAAGQEESPKSLVTVHRPAYVCLQYGISWRAYCCIVIRRNLLCSAAFSQRAQPSTRGNQALIAKRATVRIYIYLLVPCTSRCFAEKFYPKQIYVCKYK